MARLLGKEEYGETGGFAVAGEEVAPTATTKQPQIRVSVQLVRTLQRLACMLLGCWGAPATRVVEGEFGGDHLAYGGVGSTGSHGFGAGIELQLRRMHHLDFGNLNRDDNAAGGDGGLLGKPDDRIILVSNVVNMWIKSNIRGGCQLTSCHAVSHWRISWVRSFSAPSRSSHRTLRYESVSTSRTRPMTSKSAVDS